MAEETRETATSDETLSNLQDEIEEGKSEKSEEAVSETEKAEEQKVEEEPKEKSEIGRRASKRIHERLDGIDGKFNTLMETLSKFQAPSNASEYSQTAQTGEDDFISTSKDVENILDRRERRAKEEKARYDDKYLKVIDNLAEEEELDDRAIEEVSKLLTKSFNKSYSDFKDPYADADRNFQRAIRAYEKTNTKSSPLNGGSALGAGGVGGTKMTEKGLPEVKLSADAQEFKKHLEKQGSELAKPENINKVLSGKTPISLAKPIDRK